MFWILLALISVGITIKSGRQFHSRSLSVHINICASRWVVRLNALSCRYMQRFKVNATLRLTRYFLYRNKDVTPLSNLVIVSPSYTWYLKLYFKTCISIFFNIMETRLTSSNVTYTLYFKSIWLQYFEFSCSKTSFLIQVFLIGYLCEDN